MKKRILCYGDSNTWGYIPGGFGRYDEDIRWTGVLQNEVKNWATVIENGIGGRTTCFENGWGECKNGKEGLGYALLAAYPIDIAVIMLGTNDLATRNAAVAKQGINDLVMMLKRAEGYYLTSRPVFVGEPKILIIAPPSLHPECRKGPLVFFRDKYEESRKFAEYYKEVAELQNVDYLDAADLLEVSEVDCVHMDEKGHEILGKAVARKIEEMIKE